MINGNRLIVFLQMSLPSSLLPSIDLTYARHKGLSTQALLNVWSSLKDKSSITQFQDFRNKMVSKMLMKYSLDSALCVITFSFCKVASLWMPFNLHISCNECFNHGFLKPLFDLHNSCIVLLGRYPCANNWILGWDEDGDIHILSIKLLLICYLHTNCH